MRFHNFYFLIMLKVKDSDRLVISCRASLDVLWSHFKELTLSESELFIVTVVDKAVEDTSFASSKLMYIENWSNFVVFLWNHLKSEVVSESKMIVSRIMIIDESKSSYWAVNVHVLQAEFNLKTSVKIEILSR